MPTVQVTVPLTHTSSMLPKVRNTLLILWWYFLCAQWCFKGSDYIISLSSLQNPQRIIAVMLRQEMEVQRCYILTHPRPHSQEVTELGFKTLTICTIYVSTTALMSLLTFNLNIFILRGTIYHNRNETPLCPR